MIFCFPLPYFPLSTSALFFAKYSCTHIVYRRSLVTFYLSNRARRLQHELNQNIGQQHMFMYIMGCCDGLNLMQPCSFGLIGTLTMTIMIEFEITNASSCMY